MKLCLGTVQQGMEYGINNQCGKPSIEESIETFYQAIQNGIKIFDTARAYGDAELLIGEYFRRYGNPGDIKIISKLRPNVFDSDEGYYDVVKRECQNSLDRIGISKLYGYLLHTPGYIRNPEIVHALLDIKKEGMVENIGVSIYEIEDGEAAIETGVVDFIQLPYSVFDQRGDTTGFLRKAKQAGITVFTRSAFLQGLFYMDVEKVPERVEKAKPLLEKWNSCIDRFNVSKTEALIGFVKNQPYIDYLVFGVDNVKQLQEDIRIFNDYKMDDSLESLFQKEFSSVSKSIIIPSLWSNGKKSD